MNCKNLKQWQTRRTLSTIWIGLLISLNTGMAAPFNEVQFFDRVNSIYYTLDQTELQNFTAWLTSNVFINSTEGFFSGEVFPLEFIWMSGNRMFFSRRPLPALGDSVKDQLVENLQLSMRKELKAVFLDWQRFYSGKLLENMPPDYTLETVGDTVILRFSTLEEQKSVKNILKFGMNGICIKNTLTYPDQNEHIDTYPIFKFTGEKWLCTGWRVQIFEGDEISTGYLVEINAQRIEKYWLPQVIKLTLQTIRDKQSRYIREYYFRNILINRNIEVMN